MRKLLSLMLIVLIGALLVVSCNDSPTPTPPTPSDPERPATLTLSSFREYYAKDAAASELVGSLYYTDTKGKITTLTLKDEGVTTDFDSKTVGEKTLKITYKGIDCVAKYHIVDPGEVTVKGEFIVDKNTVFIFKADKKVEKEIWDNWGDYFIFNDPPEAQELGEYTIGISSTGKTIVRIGDKNFYPDGNGGLLTYPSEDAYFGSESNYAPSRNFLYVSRTKEDKRSADVAQNNYLVIGFNEYGTMFMWFVSDTAASTLAGLNKNNVDVVVKASSFFFDSSGAHFDTFTPTGYGTKAKNLRLTLNKDGYASTEAAFSIVSSTDDSYKGYAYTMKLTSVATPVDLPEPNAN